jgi:hypothetical protein
MDRSTVEKHLFASSRNYWSTFTLRIDGYDEWERRVAAKALVDCADTLSRRFGHAADDYLFGEGSFTGQELTNLFINLRRMHDHALARDFHQGVTALHALKAVASLQFARQVSEKQSVRESVASTLQRYSEELRPLVEEHRKSSAGNEVL